MQELLDYIVKNLVSKPEEIKIEETSDGQSVNFSLTVAQDDMGMIIGKAGQTIKAIRKLLIASALGENRNLRVNLTLVDLERPGVEVSK